MTRSGNSLHRPVRAGDCPLLWPVYVTGKEGTRSRRVTWCCKERGQSGFMLKHWKCVGKDHPDCPNRCIDMTSPAGPKPTSAHQSTDRKDGTK